MEASVRLLNSTNLNRHLPRSFINPKHSLKIPPNASFTSTTNPNLLLNRHISPRIKCFSPSSFPPPISNPLSFLLPPDLSKPHISNPKHNYFDWTPAPVTVTDPDPGVSKDKQGTVLTVVMLGWLGAEQKHLKRYIELYTRKGIHAVSFVVNVRDVLGFDLGKRVEKQISALAEELVSWLSDKEDDGRERGLIFHTFSNTGWLVYGAILEYLQSRGDFMGKIKGCVVDSGADPELNPQVMAAGFSAALLKKRSSAILPSVEPIRNEFHTNKNIPKLQDIEPLPVESLLLLVLEKFFTFVVKLPNVNRRLTKIISTLSKDQPPCPQLYLYSTADKVIPFGPVELFIQNQKNLGRRVSSYNFVSSPHVDHYRSFPHDYSEELYRFLKQCGHSWP